jgi:hypothetical protein
MKFRGGLLGLRPGSQVPVVEETHGHTTSSDAEAGTKRDEITPTAEGEIAVADSLDEKNGVEHRKELQFGVQAAEATLKVWTKNHLITAYVL